MHIADVKMVLQTILRQETPISVMLYGPPGIGKTTIISQVADDMGISLYTLALPTCEAVDIRGIPQVHEDRTVWRSPFPSSGRGILLLDELTSAPPDVQVAAHHLLWRERGSDVSLPPTWQVIATGNRAADRTLYRPLSAPLRNRLLMITVEPTLDGWVSWAFQQNIRPEIIGFLRWRPEFLMTTDIPESGAFPSPRSWERLSTIMSLSLGNKELYDGIVGEGVSIEFTAYMQLVSQLPRIEALLQAPQKAEVPTSPSLLCALVSAFSTYTRATGRIGMAYLQRLPAEYVVLYLLDIRGQTGQNQELRNQLRHDPPTRAWVKAHARLFKDEE